MANVSADKEIYEALQAVNALLDATGEQMLVDLVEKIRTGLRRERMGLHAHTYGVVDATLKRWMDFDAAEKPEHEAEYGPGGLPGGEGGYVPSGTFLPGRQGGKIL